MSLRRAHGLASLVLLVLSACAEGGADDPTKVDGSANDGSATDGAATDAPADGKGDAPSDAAKDADATTDGTASDAPSDAPTPDSGTPDTGTPDTGSDAIVLFPCTKDTDCVSPFNCCVPSSKSCGVKVVITCVPFP